MNEEKIRQEIFEKVKLLYKLRRDKDKFIPGKSPVHYAGRVYDEQEMVALVDSALDFWLTSGRYAERFEKEFADFLKVKHCLLTNSGSSANLLAISALTSPKLGEKRLKPGDEVITTACGFPTTMNPLIQNGLKPVLVDVELGTYNIQADAVEDAISDKTKAIFVAHTLGNPVNLEKVQKLVQEHNLWFIEDNCDALGSKYHGKYTGSFGDLSTFSFYPAHHITMGEGGAIVTNDTQLKDIVASFRDWGRDCWCEPGCDNTCGKRFGWKWGDLPFGYDHKYVYTHIGYNLKVTDMQAAIGVEQLKKLPSFIKSRTGNFQTIFKYLKDFKEYFIFPTIEENVWPSWFGFPIMVKNDAPFTRDEIVEHLEGNKIATRMLFGGNLTKQPAYKDVDFRYAGPLLNTDLVMDNLFWIGVYPGISRDKMDYLLEVFKQFLTKF
jgi:CDP-6-deoxy-D-xylo-4-hexulose-3-dehydrase